MEKSKEFEERKKLIELQERVDLQKHNWKMEELEFSRENNRLFHEREMERGRIKWAEIKKSQQRKADMDWMQKNNRKY